MEGNVFDCSLNYDPTSNPDKYVFVSFGELLGYESTTLSYELDYKLIQILRQIRGRKMDGHLQTIEQAEKELIKEHIRVHRPGRNWKDIADMLGINQKTLWKRRNKYNLK